MHVETDVLVADDGGFASVQPDANSDRFVVWPCVDGKLALRLRGRATCVQSTLEYAEERIAFRTQLAPGAALERCAQDLVMLDLGLDIFFAKLVHQLSRTLDVGKKERYGAGRKTHWGDAVRAGSRMLCKSLDSWR